MRSLGCTIYQMFTNQYLIGITTKYKDAIIKKNRFIPKDAQDKHVFGLLELDYNKRLKFSNVSNNNFIE